MATTDYAVLSTVLSGKRYEKGSTIPLSDEDAAPLLKLGVIKVPGPSLTASVTVTTVPALGKPTLGKLTVAELTAYAVALGLTVAEGATKDQLLEAIGAAMPAPAVPAPAVPAPAVPAGEGA